MEKLLQLLEELHAKGALDTSAWCTLLAAGNNEAFRAVAAEKARKLTLERFGNGVFVRGIVEFSNYCVNDCVGNFNGCYYDSRDDICQAACNLL